VDLRLVVHTPDGIGQDVVVLADASTPTLEVLDAMRAVHDEAENGSARQRGREPVGAYVARLGQWLTAHQPWGAAGLVHGDRLLLSRHAPPASDEPSRGAAMLVVVRGPFAGRRFALGPGTYVIGRRSDADIALPDDEVSGRHLEVSVQTSGTRLTDLSSRNGTLVDGTRLAPSVPTIVNDGARVTIGQTEFAVLSPAQQDHRRTWTPTGDGHVLLRPSPRVGGPIEPLLVELPSPPSEASARNVSILASAAPIALGLVLAVALSQPWMLVTALFSPLMAFITTLEGRRSFARHRASYRDATTASARKLRAACEAEAAALARDLPGTVDLLQRARGHAPEIWQRRPRDDDFLWVRVGTARQSVRSTWRIAPGGNTLLRTEAEEALRAAGEVSAPVPLDMRASGALGLCGDGAAVADVARWVVLQAAVHQSPSELWIAAVATEARASTWESMKWLPHVRPAPASDGLGAAGFSSGLLAVDAEERARLLRLLLQISRSDGEASLRGRGKAADAPTVLLLIDQPAEHDSRLVNDLVSTSGEGRLVVLCVAADRRALPGGVRAILDLPPGTGESSLHDLVGRRIVGGIRPDRLPMREFRQGALALAPLRDALLTGNRTDLPALVSLAGLLDMAEITPDAVAKRWR
jgi:S-DNA-T family DNA segregation ATPase FtsK/SpoIIIE